MESVKLLLLSCVKSPGLAAVQYRAQNAGPINLDLDNFRQLLAGPYSQGAVQLKTVAAQSNAITSPNNGAAPGVMLRANRAGDL